MTKKTTSRKRVNLPKRGAKTPKSASSKKSRKRDLHVPRRKAKTPKIADVTPDDNTKAMKKALNKIEKFTPSIKRVNTPKKDTKAIIKKLDNIAVSRVEQIKKELGLV
jgi:hypothetical protein